MAETIRYDTSDDPVAAQQIAEKEAESLKIGEELMAKQEKMLAGKYKNVEDLEAAYNEPVSYTHLTLPTIVSV